MQAQAEGPAFVARPNPTTIGQVLHILVLLRSTTLEATAFRPWKSPKKLRASAPEAF